MFKSKKTKILTLVVFIFGLIALIVLLPFFAFMHPTCDVKNINQFISTDGQYTANLLVKDCGATSDYSTHVELKNNQTEDQAQVLAIRGDLSDTIKVSWDNSNLLKISYEANDDRFYNSMNQFGKVKIEVLQNNQPVGNK